MMTPQNFCHLKSVCLILILILVYAVSDDMVYQFVTTPPASKYFSDLVSSLREQCLHLDTLVHSTEYVAFNF